MGWKDALSKILNDPQWCESVKNEMDKAEGDSNLQIALERHRIYGHAQVDARVRAGKWSVEEGEARKSIIDAEYAIRGDE